MTEEEKTFIDGLKASLEALEDRMNKLTLLVGDHGDQIEALQDDFGNVNATVIDLERQTSELQSDALDALSEIDPEDLVAAARGFGDLQERVDVLSDSLVTQ